MTAKLLRAAMLSALADAIASMRFDQPTASFLRSIDLSANTFVIAAGKGASDMVAGAVQVLGDRINDGLVVAPDHTRIGPFAASLRVLRASHPLPDLRSVQAANLALELAARAPADSSLIVLVSGGASSLLCAPPLHVPLADKLSLVRSLLTSGARIHDVNTVRRHLSRIKGGRLALASKAQVICVVASDVISGHAHDVGSGPACEDPTTTADAIRIVAETLGEAQAHRVCGWLSDGLAAGAAESKRVITRIVVRPEDFGTALAKLLDARGLVSTNEVIDDVTDESLSARMVSAASVLPAGCARVITCEPTVRLPERIGIGGRAGRVALRALIDPALPEDTVVLCAATDGVDGSSGAAGACVCKLLDGGARREELQQALDRFDDSPVHRGLGTRLAFEPTGINLTDVYVVARPKN